MQRYDLYEDVLKGHFSALVNVADSTTEPLQKHFGHYQCDLSLTREDTAAMSIRRYC